MVKKQIPKPQHWQDFESLCKSLWKEVWQCPEIVKNGRTGQSQSGVDIYGIPKGEDLYYGIQCKGKDDYTKARLANDEIDYEIELAKNFTPPLKKFYFATTANKDVVVESYIRAKNIQHKADGLFEVHLFSWEDIADLIEENVETFNWYVRKLDFKTRFNAALTFSDNHETIGVTPEVNLYKESYIDKDKLKKHGIDVDAIMSASRKATLALGNPLLLGSITEKELSNDQMNEDTTEQLMDCQPVTYLNKLDVFLLGKKRINKSCFTFKLKLSNIGSEAIENYKIYLTFDNVVNVDTVSKRREFLDMNRYSYNVMFQSHDNATIKPKDNALVQNDSIEFDEICVRPKIECDHILLTWRLVAKDFTDQGELHINVKHKINEINWSMYVSNPDQYVPKTFIKTEYIYLR